MRDRETERDRERVAFSSSSSFYFLTRRLCFIVDHKRQKIVIPSNRQTQREFDAVLSAVKNWSAACNGEGRQLHPGT